MLTNVLKNLWNNICLFQTLERNTRRDGMGLKRMHPPLPPSSPLFPPLSPPTCAGAGQRDGWPHTSTQVDANLGNFSELSNVKEIRVIWMMDETLICFWVFQFPMPCVVTLILNKIVTRAHPIPFSQGPQPLLWYTIQLGNLTTSHSTQARF